MNLPEVSIAVITGGIAQAFYGIPEPIRTKALTYLDSPSSPSSRTLNPAIISGWHAQEQEV